MSIESVRIAHSLLGALYRLELCDAPNAEAEPTSFAYIKWMCFEIINHPEWDQGKAHRWIGFIQGVMVANQWSTVDDERTRIRKFIAKTEDKDEAIVPEGRDNYPEPPPPKITDKPMKQRGF